MLHLPCAPVVQSIQLLGAVVASTVAAGDKGKQGTYQMLREASWPGKSYPSGGEEFFTPLRAMEAGLDRLPEPLSLPGGSVLSQSKVVPPDLSVEGSSVDSQYGGRSNLVTFGAAKDHADVIPLQVLQRGLFGQRPF
jgi:hypothetical protein